MFLIYVSSLILFASFSNAADILAILPTPSYSHQIAYTHIWRELSLRGHKVTTITTNPLKDPTLTNLTEIDFNFFYSRFSDTSKIVEVEMTMWNSYEIMFERMVGMVEAQLSMSPIQELIHNKTKFDVVLTEFLFPEYLAFAEIYKCPKIIISSLDADAYYHHKVGNPSHPVLNPQFMTPFYGSLSFIERVESTLYELYVKYFFNYKWLPAKQKLVEKYFNKEFNLKEIINDVDMMFLNVNPAIQVPRAVGPTTINIGGQRKPVDSTPLPKDIEQFLDSAREGFIYFSLGSNVKSKDLNEGTLQTLIETLGEVPYKVLWKFEADTLPGKPDNIKLIKWAPQEKVLAHPNIKLFVTQGGLQSTEESIFSAVPLVVIPFFGDQEQNAKLMKSKGIARIVQRKPTLKKEDLKSAILEVINNPSYRNSVRRLKHLALDTPMTGLEKAVWWTEYVIRNKGAKHLRNPAADIPLYQYYLLDVISFLLIVTASVLLVIISLVNILYKFFLNNFVGKNFIYSKKIQ